MRRALWLSAFLFGLGIALPARAVTCPPLPYNLLNGTIVDAVQVMADLNALRNCINGGSGGAATLLNVAQGGTKTPGSDNDTPVNLPGDTLYFQAFPLSFSTAHNVGVTDMQHSLVATGSSLVPFTLGAPGSVGFEKGNLVCFVGVGAGGFSLQGVTNSIQGVPTSLGVATFPQYSSACAVSDPPNWTVSASLGTAGIGTVTSISAGTGITLTPDPITSTGTVALTTPVACVNGGTGFSSYANGEILIGNSGGCLDKTTLTAGSGVSITNNAGSITITNTGSGGTVTSIGLSMPGIFSVSGSPVTTSGTIAVSLASQTANLAWMAPNGSAGAPLFRSIVAADLPADVAYIDVANNWTAHQTPVPVALTDGSSITVNGTDANLYTLTITGDSHTLACPSTIKTGTYNFRITQDGTGHTGFATASCYKYPGGTAPSWSTAASAVDVLSCSAFDGARLECNGLIDLQ